MTVLSTTDKTLPAGFKDNTPRVLATILKRARHKKLEHEDGTIEYQPLSFNDGQEKAVRHILDHVVRYQGDYLTCFADNRPMIGNDLATTVDACKLNTKALSRSMITDLLLSAPLNFQRYAYYPGFPRFLKVDGATCYNTWHPAQRLIVSDDDLKRWARSKTQARAEVGKKLTDDAIEIFICETEPSIWRVMLRMLFGDVNSPTSSPNWVEEHEVFTKWFSCVVHRPLERVRWAPVLRGAHGVGKGTFQHLAQALMGSGSIKTVHDLEGIAGQFAGENALTRLLAVDEVWSKSGKAMQQFKPIISEDYVQVERKGEQRFSTRAVHDTIVFSNYHKPFTAAETERRWWVPAYRDYDLEPDRTKADKQAFHAEGNRLIRAALPLSPNANQDQIRDLLCWLKMVASTVPASFFATAPSSIGLPDMLDVAATEAHDEVVRWLDSLQTKDAISLADLVARTDMAQSQLTPILTELCFRNCQMKSQGNRKVWTKAPNGTGPNRLVSYQT